MEGMWNNRYSPLPHYEVVRVRGRAGAENFRMGPNSSALLLDETDRIIWLVQTDGAGYLTATPFDYNEHIEAPQIDNYQLYTKIQELEERLNGIQSDFTNAKRAKKSNPAPKQSTAATEGTN